LLKTEEFDENENLTKEVECENQAFKMLGNDI